MTLAIVTVTRDNLAGLRSTLASLDTQTRAPDEHWIIDGASTDGSREFLASLPPRPGLRFISEPDAGIYDAMNKGVALSGADFVWFLNAGDTCADDQVVADLETALDRNTGVDCLYGKVWRQNRHGLRSVGGPVRPRDFRHGMPVCHQAVVYRRAWLLASPYPADFRLISDWIVTRRLFESGAPCVYMDRHLAIYNLDGVSTRSHFAMTREKLRRATRLRERLSLLVVCGSRAIALWLAHRTGFYDWLKRRQHHPRIAGPGAAAASANPRGTTRA